jgi:tetratricopeptide (TPR) repeat protein
MKISHYYPLLLLLLFARDAEAVPNCYIYKDNKDCYEACLECEKAIRHTQGTRASQIHFVKAIEKCPEMTYAYFEKSEPYAKRGLMPEWKVSFDKAVELEPKLYLGQRGWYQWFFLKNYREAIKDIDAFDDLVDYDIGPSGDGEHHLYLVKSLCYRGLGQLDSAIQVAELLQNNEDYYAGPFDYIHTAVNYILVKDYETALKHLDLQEEYNDMSEVNFYRAKVFLAQGLKERAESELETALEKYDRGLQMTNGYRQIMDEIYRSDILGLM